MTGHIELRFGQEGCALLPATPAVARRVHLEPSNLAEPWDALRRALAHPLDFPPLSRAVVEGDQVVLALERHTPLAQELIAEIWQVLAAAGVQAKDVLILQPTALGGPAVSDPRGCLPDSVRKDMGWRVHDATDPQQQAYLATSSAGERLYLARELIEADFVLPIGEVAYDSVQGYRGTNSVLYPGLSNAEAIRKSRGFGHQELSPEDVRPIRQLMEEVGWLLGIQFTVQVLAGAGTGISAVFAGHEPSVWQSARQLLDATWHVQIPERVDTVLVAVPTDAGGHGWNQIGSALATARGLVRKGGTVIVLSELEQQVTDLSPALEIVRASHTAREAIRPLREQTPVEYLPASQLSQLADWANIYLVSQLDAGLVDDLFMQPLESWTEAVRLWGQSESAIAICGAQHTYGRVAVLQHA